MHTSLFEVQKRQKYKRDKLFRIMIIEWDEGCRDSAKILATFVGQLLYLFDLDAWIEYIINIFMAWSNNYAEL